MTGFTRALVCAGGLAAVAAVAAAQPRRSAPADAAPAAPAPSPDLRVRSSLSQTAAWVGDPLEFVVEIDTAPGVEVVADDLQPEKLAIEGLELGPMTASESTRADGWRTLRRAYRVTAWDTTPPKRIGAMTVRFRRPVTTATATGAAPAAELTVPGATLAVRSTLPDDGSADGARDRQAALPAPGWTGWLRPLGFGLAALGIAPVVLWVASFIRRPRVVKPRPSSRSLHALSKALLDELQIIDTSSVEGRTRAYDRIDHDVRAYVAQAESIPASALTADELRERLASATRVQGAAICEILAECERARYAPSDRMPGADAIGDTIGRLRSALGR